MLHALATMATVVAAAAPWSSPHVFGDSATGIFEPGVTFTDSGRGTISWTQFTDEGYDDDVVLATAPRGSDVFTSRGTFRPARRVYAGSHGNLAVYGRGATVVSGVTGGNHVSVVWGRSGKRSTVRLLGIEGQAGRAQVVANPRGDVAVAALAGVRKLRLYVTVRRAGHGFGRPVRISRASRDYGGAMDLAIDDRGGVLVAWQQDGSIRARTLTRHGRLRAGHRLGPGENAQISVTPRTVAWESRVGADTEVAVARAAGGGRFGPATKLDRFSGHIPLTTCETLVDATDDVVAWTSLATGRPQVRTTAGTVSDPASDACLGDVSDDGTAIVWAQGGTLTAAMRTNAAFGPAEPISASLWRDGRVAVDPRTHRAVVAWIDDANVASYAVREPPTE
jgi:hypothetical protein